MTITVSGAAFWSALIGVANRDAVRNAAKSVEASEPLPQPGFPAKLWLSLVDESSQVNDWLRDPGALQ